MGEFDPDRPAPDEESQPTSPVTCTDQELLRNPQLGILFMIQARQHIEAIVGAFPGISRLANLADEIQSECEDELRRRMLDADDPTMSHLDRWEQWFKVELGAGCTTEEEIAASRADLMENLDPEDLDPVGYNAWLQNRRREHQK